MNTAFASLRLRGWAVMLGAALAASSVLAQPALGAGAGAPVVTTPQVRAELLAHAPQGVAPGQPLWLGLQITHQPQWHSYWKNSGDSGKPTELRWTLPSGLVAGDIEWPLPHKIPVANMVNYGYDGTVLLAVPVTVLPAFKPSPLSSDIEVRLHADWLVCRKECIPESGDFSLRLPVRGSTALHGPAFEAAQQSRPTALKTSGKDGIRVQGLQLQVSVGGLPSAWQGKSLEFFPEVAEVIETAAPWTQRWDGNTWSAQVPVSAQRLNSPAVLPVVLTQGNSGVRLEMKVVGKWPPVVDPLAAGAASAALVAPASQAAASAAAAHEAAPQSTTAASAAVALRSPTAAPPAAAALGSSLALALLGAVLGGLILNLMPCVFPVLAIKLLHFAQHGQDRRGQRLGALAYSLGVVLSFVALGALLLALRAAGESLGWGFQLQNPWVVAALAALFTVLGLNLAGLFEFGQVLPSSVATLQARHPVLDAVLTGVLAVAIASPCTAPFMGASLGFAVALPTHEALLVFAALGLGMALPYLAVSLTPQLARLLPRPGAWMQNFRQLMAFPMFGTVVWLVWVLGQQSGIDGAASLLALLVGLSSLIWALSLHGRGRVVLSLVLAALLGWMGLNWGPLLATPMSVPSVVSHAAAPGQWQPWSAERVRQATAQGQAVFVDFTAAWCVTCQVNKRTTLADASVLADFEQRKVLLLRADWTRRDAAITQALSALGRSGVPVYVLHRPGKTPVVLSELLSVAEVRAALEQL